MKTDAEAHDCWARRAVNTAASSATPSLYDATVKADLAAISTSQDLRSHARKTLDAIEATIEGRASLDQERYRINNRELYRTPLETLKKLRDQYRAEVSREEAKLSGKSMFGKTLRVRLG